MTVSDQKINIVSRKKFSVPTTTTKQINNMTPQRVLITLTTIIAIVGITGALASIETNKPVPVTHRNSGPRYDIDDVEKTRLTPAGDNENQQPPESTNGDDSGPTMGHVSIRRIFLVPMMPGPVHPPDSLWSQSSAESRNHQQQGDLEREQPNHHHLRSHIRPLFGGPSDPDQSPSNENHNNSPFLPMSFHHLFGQDLASRSPSDSPKMQPSSGSEISRSPEEQAARDRFHSAILDPIQMMIEMMQQALHQAQPTSKGDEPTTGTDLNKEASSKPEQENSNDRLFGGLNKTLKPLNETKEDVVEIDGKKYLRKTVINRHVGENIIFMTKRLVFVPLNETDSTTTEVQPITTTTTTTNQPIINETPSTTTTATEISKKVEFEPTTIAPVSSTSSEPTITVETGATINKEEKDKVPEEPKVVEELTTGTPTTSKPVESISP